MTSSPYRCECGKKKTRTAKKCSSCHARDQRSGAKHGTANMYSNHGCRCRPCKTAWAKYRRKKEKV